MFQAISPVAKVLRSVAEALSAMQPAMRTVPRPIGSARPSRGPSAPAATTPNRPVPRAMAKTAPTVASDRCAWLRPIRPLTPQREFCARDQQSRVAARTTPARGNGRGVLFRGGPAGDRTDRQTARQRPDGQRGERDRGERQAVPRAEVRDRQIDGARERGDPEQAHRGGAVRVALGGDPGGGDRGGRTGAEAAEHRAGDDGGDVGGEGGAAVAEDGQCEADPGQGPGADPFDAGGEQEARRRRTQQQRTADGTRLRGGQR